MSKTKKQEAKKNEQPSQPVILDPVSLSGHLIIDKEFNAENITPIIRSILYLNLLPKDKQPKRILLDINSPGGTVWNLSHLIQTMIQSKIPVDTHTSGLAASCGCLLLMAGRVRTATPMADIMSHQYSWNSQGKEHELYGRIKAFKSGSKKMMAMYKAWTGKSESYIRKHLLGATDVWLTAKEAKKHGIIDHVVSKYQV